MIKKAGIIVVALVAAVLVLSGMKNGIAKFAIDTAAERITGIKLGIGSLNMSIIKTFIGIKDFRVYNPAGFKDKIMADIPEIYVDYDLPAALKGDVHLYDMRLDLKECFIIKNENGLLNLDSLKTIQKQSKKSKPKQAPEASDSDFQIDRLELKIGRVVYKDYSSGIAPNVLQFNINLNEKYENITDPDALVSLIIVKVIMNTTIGRLIKLDITGLQDTIGNTLSSATHITGRATKAVGGAGKALTETAGGITKIFGGK